MKILGYDHVVPTSMPCSPCLVTQRHIQEGTSSALSPSSSQIVFLPPDLCVSVFGQCSYAAKYDSRLLFFSIVVYQAVREVQAMNTVEVLNLQGGIQPHIQISQRNRSNLLQMVWEPTQKKQCGVILFFPRRKMFMTQYTQLHQKSTKKAFSYDFFLASQKTQQTVKGLANLTCDIQTPLLCFKPRHPQRFSE